MKGLGKNIDCDITKWKKFILIQIGMNSIFSFLFFQGENVYWKDEPVGLFSFIQVCLVSSLLYSLLNYFCIFLIKKAKKLNQLNYIKLAFIVSSNVACPVSLILASGVRGDYPHDFIICIMLFLPIFFVLLACLVAIPIAIQSFQRNKYKQ